MTKQFLILWAILFCVFAQEEQEEHDEHDEHQEQGHLSTEQIWGFGFLACLAVSLIGFLAAGVLVIFKRFGNQACFDYIVRFLFSLACGALLGDVLVHILPQAFKSESTISSIVALIFISSVGFFLILERIFHKCGIAHSHWHADGENCDHSDPAQSNQQDSPQKPKKQMSKNPEHKHGRKQTQMIKVEQIAVPALESNQKIGDSPVKINLKSSELRNSNDLESSSNHIRNEEQTNDGIISQFKGKDSAGYLNLLGSLIHNFVDGLALGVAFATGDSAQFIPVLIAIVAHQIPRQLGDVAILLKSSFTSAQTIICNGTVNLVSLIGGIIGLAIQHLDEAVKMYILVFVAGNFIFVAADIWKHILKSSTWYGNLIEATGFVIGVGVMFLLLLLEGEEGHNH